VNAANTGEYGARKGADVHSSSREADVIARARAHGIDLIQRETDTGNLIWSWRTLDLAPQPSFLSRAQAVAYMASVLDRMAA